jgi:predicted Zn-dependent protease
MKRWTTTLLVAGLCAWIAASPASAQILGKLGKAGELASKASELNITESEEIELGRQISEKIRQRYGVVQSPEVHKYVTLVGAVLATSSTRPNLPWTFIVLDTDAVNAFAAPGGYVHITKGALAQIKNEAELAGVLGHELTHVTEKHTIAAIKKGKAADLAVSATGKGGGFTQEFIDKAKDAILQGFGQKEELEADAKGITLASKVGYSPTGLPEFLQALSDRNKNSTERKGLFASHPEMDERMKKLQDTITKNKLASTAVLEARYKKVITFQPKALTEIATVEAGSAGLVGGGGAKKPESQTAKNEDASKKESEKKKGGFGLGKLGSSFGGGEKKQAQVSGSGAARGVGNEDLAAKGGANPALVAVKITPADIEAFKKEGKLS